MNREWVLMHFQEVLEELTQTISNVATNNAYGEIDFGIAMQHLYHHVNTAWNARNEESEHVADFSDEDFYQWRAFPSDIPTD